MKIEVTNKTLSELQEVAKQHPEGFIQAIRGLVYWVFTK